MALLRSQLLKRIFVSKPAVICNTAKQASHWTEDYIPGELPKTEQERIAAAKKYGLLPHEYDTYPEDTTEGSGDYPKLPIICSDEKDPYYPWDYPAYKRNYNEVWHCDYDVYTEDRVDSRNLYRTPVWKRYAMFLGVVFGSYFLTELGKNYTTHRPVCAKQFPGRGKVHYSFETGQS